MPYIFSNVIRLIYQTPRKTPKSYASHGLAGHQIPGIYKRSNAIASSLSSLSFLNAQLVVLHRKAKVKPIFHCDAKLLALGTFASANAKDSTFALPNAKNTNMLVSLALGDANFSPFYPTRNLKVAFYPMQNPNQASGI